MANRHYNVDREYDITLNFKVRATSISDYNYLSQERLDEILNELEQELKLHFLWKISQENIIESVGADYVKFEMVD